MRSPKPLDKVRILAFLYILEVWRIAHDRAKVGDQVRLLTRILLTLEPDGKATGGNPVEVGSIPIGVFD